MKNSKLEICPHCIQGKASRLPYPSSLGEKSKNPYSIGEKLHSDIAGPMRNPNYNKKELYFLTFIDHTSNYSWVYLMTHKSEAPGLICEHIKMLERQKGIKVKILKNDRGAEYIESGKS